VLAVVAAIWARFDFDPSAIEFRGVATVVIMAIGAQVAIGFLLGVYRARYWPGSVDEAKAVGITALATGLFLAVVALAAESWLVPRSTALSSTALALCGMLSLRLTARVLRDRPTPESHEARRAIVFGAGVTGERLIRQMHREPETGFLPVALLDDDTSKQNLRLLAIDVVGDRTTLVDVAARTDAAVLIIAVPRASSSLLADLGAAADTAKLQVLVVPSLSDLWGGQVTTGDLRELDVDDLLGRRPVKLDLDSIKHAVTGKRILVTGAGGSIGAELCRQLQRFGPSTLVMLDRDESALHSVQLSLEGSAFLDGPNTVLADIRDLAALDEAFSTHRPEVVFHAAALKHLTMLEKYPAEAWKTNVEGTMNVLQASRESGVGVFINISTDKAADPCSVLGYSKRITERLTAGVENASGRYLSVRFGNVLGSRGSVLTVFTDQVARGADVTVTAPGVERYFMTIPEACQLVLQAASIGGPGEVLVLDMGEPVRIADVARTLINRTPGCPSTIVYTGLRPGEKLTEVLFGEGESALYRPRHPLVSHVSVPGMRSIDVPGIDEVRPAHLVSTLRNLAFGRVGLHGEEPTTGLGFEEIQTQLIRHR
jgi:FlaA1/EpsC-like NDP-sugar epimerase